MPIVVSCPSCSARFNAKDEWAGRKAKCPKCGTVLTVPAAGPADAPAPPAAPKPSPSPKPPAAATPAPRPVPKPEPAAAGFDVVDDETEEDTEEAPSPRKPARKSGSGVLKNVLGILGGLALLGCVTCGGVGYWLYSSAQRLAQQIDKEIKSTKPKRPAEQPAEVTLSADALYKDREKYDGKWVIAVARIPRIHLDTFADGWTEATLDLLGDDGRVDSQADVPAGEWNTPKIEDGIRYELIGLYDKGGTFGGRLKFARVIGPSKSEGPAAGPTLSVAELTADAAKYKDKPVQVKGTVKSGNPPQAGGVTGVVTLGDAEGKTLICLLGPGQFEKLVRNRLGGTLELKGILTSAGPSPTVSDGTVVSSETAGPTIRAAVFRRDFASNPAGAAKANEGKVVTVNGKVESTADGKLVLTGYKEKNRPAGVKLVAFFSPDWKDALAKVKVGDDVSVSGDFGSGTATEVTLTSCWLLPR
jgi:predicted Zn finger-like uncharacterized protein